MAITCNFDKDDCGNRKDDKVIVRIPPGQNIGNDSPAPSTAKNGAYLWVMGPRPRSGKSWRDPSSVN